MKSLFLLGVVCLTACAGAVESSKLEDKARRTVPVPICLKPLERHGAAGVVSSLKPDDYWTLVIPAFDTSSSTVDAGALDCGGRAVFTEKDLLEADGPRTGSIPVKLEDATISPGPDGFKVVWLRTHRFTDSTAGGPLALMRPREGYAEVYATGFYRGGVQTTRFNIERLGPKLLVTATNEGCAGVKPNQNCESAYSIYLMRAGRLLRAADFPLDRIEYGTAAGVSGLAQYRLTATPVFAEKNIRVVEQVVVKDPNQGAVRKSDLERIFTLDPTGKLVASADSLWTQIMTTRGGTSVPAPGANPPVNPPPPPGGVPPRR
ncbi:MAG TPA: hypothetical protein VFQ61_29755 [Polyangiaceae bacterium]|nr:hypothetical protein [Polyangiaceae bacterium]